MKKIISPLLIFFIITTASAQDITGKWYGLLKVQGTQLRIVFNITKTENGFSSTMDSPDQGVRGIRVTTTTFDNGILKLSVGSAGIQYEGGYKENMIAGIFKQGGAQYPLDFSREQIVVKAALRPQEPSKPYPYYSDEIEFKNINAKIALSGTLTLPEKNGTNYPVVILITGSGPQDRDESLLGHKPFLIISDYLTRNGIAVLRYDDRGTAQSGGNFKTATSADFATDVEAAIGYLKTRKEINQAKIGLMGHSEGGMIAPMVAANNPDVNFIVLLAGPGIAGDKLLLLQQGLIAKAAGTPVDAIAKSQEQNARVFEMIKKSTNDEKLKADIKSYLTDLLKDSANASKLNGMDKDNYAALQTEGITTPWMQYFIKYDPSIALTKVRCPVLAINGEKDLQVPPKENLEAIGNALKKARNKNVTIKEFPGLNHLFQECQTGAPSEYGTIEQTFSPTALAEITKWIKFQAE
ncbi:MAG TPA: alpha/beta hydrolase [Chitinophagaceae bacterium]|nr:alpha/beta hydrolase [Chitinophagaceae bacterium]